MLINSCSGDKNDFKQLTAWIRVLSFPFNCKIFASEPARMGHKWKLESHRPTLWYFAPLFQICCHLLLCWSYSANDVINSLGFFLCSSLFSSTSKWVVNFAHQTQEITGNSASLWGLVLCVNIFGGCFFSPSLSLFPGFNNKQF